MKTAYLTTRERRVSHETIYLSLSVCTRAAVRKELPRYLRTGRVPRSGSRTGHGAMQARPRLRSHLRHGRRLFWQQLAEGG